MLEVSFFLIVVLCLASGSDAECRYVSVGPLKDRDECQARYDAIKAQMAGLDVAHIGARCEKGWVG